VAMSCLCDQQCNTTNRKLTFAVCMRVLFFCCTFACSVQEEERAAYTGGEEEDQLNARAIAVIERIQMKLTGRDFVTSAASAAGGSSRSVGNSSRAGKDKSALQQQLGVEHQVDQLIQQATDVHNLCQLFTG
jgi:FATC domain